MQRLLLLGLVVILTACKADTAKLEFSGETMGTTYSIVALDPTATLEEEDVKAAIERTLSEVNAKMSNWDPNSEISRFNAAESTEPVEISPELATVMEAADAVHEASLGQFDVTLGPLIELWGFGARTPESPIPSDASITAALDSVGQSKVLTLTKDPATLSKKRSDTSVYLAAIAKGHGVDEVAATLERFGIEDFMVEIGGDLYASGKNPDGQPWRIGIERPDATDRAVEEVVALSGLGMATSGDYRNYFEEDGVRYSHIIDAVTGRPVTHKTASVTVLAESAMLADAWATALLALGQERGMAVSKRHDLAVYFIVRDEGVTETGFSTRVSPRFEAVQAGK
ncbi:MAG: FAD:protein FMN transferase [Pseudomonadota bacterium]